MRVYCYQGPFAVKYSGDESIKFMKIIRALKCEYEQAYNLFSSYIEIYQNISHHAVNPPNLDSVSANSITLFHSIENQYALRAQNLISVHQVEALQERLTYVKDLKKAKEYSALGLYMLTKSSKKALEWAFVQSKYSDLKIFNLIIQC